MTSQGLALRLTVATKDIDEGEELFSISRSEILDVENSEIPEHFRELDPWLALVAAMILEYRKKGDSKWSEYFKVLPQHLDTLIYWSPAELEELHGSAVVNKIGKEEAEQAFLEQLLPKMLEDSHFREIETTNATKPVNKSAFLEIAHRMASLVMAYAFDVEREEPQSEEYQGSEYTVDIVKSMIPLADVFNADGDLNNVCVATSFPDVTDIVRLASYMAQTMSRC